MSSINHPHIRQAICSRLPCQQYRSVALISRGWWSTLSSNRDYQQARACSNLYNAGLLGRRDLAELFIREAAATWELCDGMQGAAHGGHTQLVDFFIQKGATNYREAKGYAAAGGHTELVAFFESKLQ